MEGDINLYLADFMFWLTRCDNPDTQERYIVFIRWFKQYCIDNNLDFENKVIKGSEKDLINMLHIIDFQSLLDMQSDKEYRFVKSRHGIKAVECR